MPLFTSFAGQPIHLLVQHNPLSRLSGVSPKEQGNVFQQILANSGIIPIALFILMMFVEGQQEFFLTWTSKAFYERYL